MFKIKTNETKTEYIIECLYNNIMQGSVVVSGDSVSLNIKEYIDKGNGVITLRSAVPETEFSEYNITKILLDAIKKRGLVHYEYFYKLTPENFGYKSYESSEIADRFSYMNKDELIKEIVDMTLTLEQLEKQGII